MEEKLWIKYESILFNSYSSSGLFASSDIVSEFKSFVGRFKVKALNSTGTDNKYNYVDDPPVNNNGIPTENFNSHFTLNMVIDKKLINPFQLREVPFLAVKQFEFIILQYFKFRNFRRFKKLEALKKCQASLPIAKVRTQILDILNESQILVIAGDTGCGKSTQLPQYLLQSGRYGKIVCTQPRRLACTALARRVSCEMLKQFSSEVAFQTRFDKTKTGSTKLLFLTEGVLLRQLISDPDLIQYDVIILDEVHERNVSGDLIVSLLRNVCYRRPGLKLILMSATINIDLFTSFFPNSPVIKIPGRLYPIELKYLPPKFDNEKKKNAKIDTLPYVNVLQLIDTKYPSSQRGDVLIFLNGISEISMVADSLKEYADFTKKWIILVLHSTLSVEEQNKVFDVAPQNVRKCILSTNIAETSVTIDEIRFVIDSGKENQMRFETQTRSHRLTETWISKASANQRKGRAGRTGPGVCFRLYSEDDFNKMDDFTLPEIKRISLESLIMQILDMNLEVDVRDFEFLERPDNRSLLEALESVKSQGIVDSKNEKLLTPIGTILSKLPVSIPIGKMLISACVLDQVDVTLTIAAGLSVQSPFTNRSYRNFECIQSRQHLISDLGDPFTLIKVYREWLKLRSERNDTRKWTRKCGIEEARLYEIVKLRRQLYSILEESELVPKTIEKREFEAMNTREKRIKVGEKRKLQGLKQKADFQDRKSKILKQGCHFDTIMDEKSTFEDNNENEQKQTDPQNDINSLEFSIMIDNRTMYRELVSHKLNDSTATVLKMIISTGCYPQYALVDTANSFRVGHDFFSHTATKPFVVVHPNSSIGQIPESLQEEGNNKVNLPFRQIIFYGLLLETTKSFLCNSSRIPALFLLFSAKNIILQTNKSLLCDEFVELLFENESNCNDVLKTACKIRYQFYQSIQNKLNIDDYGDVKEMQKNILNFAKLDVKFIIKKNFTDPSKFLDFGVFYPNGEEHPFSIWNEYENNFDDQITEDAEGDKFVDEQLDNKQIEEKKINGREYYCTKCEKTIWFQNNVEIIRHKKEHESETI